MGSITKTSHIPFRRCLDCDKPLRHRPSRKHQLCSSCYVARTIKQKQKENLLKNKKAQFFKIFSFLVIAIMLVLGSIVSMNLNYINAKNDTNSTEETSISPMTITIKLLPNNKTAPGDILTNNLSVICHSGYSATVRDVPQSLREKVFARDNLTLALQLPTGTTELDHIIPLCLGGSNSEKNLWVEFASPRPGYKEKDKLENYLCDHVCSGEVDINVAQKKIAENWFSYYKEVYNVKDTDF